ncbi:MAG: amino acid racemase [Bacteroidales bacterium]|nr:amino acid racemase [Bacteroidales bacterium]
MKKPGLIGGVGPESSIEYYKLIIKRFQKKLNTKDYPELVINSINMTEMLGYVFTNQLDRLTDFLSERIKILELSGVDFAAIASNTPHIVFDRLAERVKIPLVSIVEETCKYIKIKKIKRVGLFGTKSTMTSGFYNQVAEEYGIEVIVPELIQQDYIHEKYMGELIYNRILSDTRQGLVKIVRDLEKNESIQGLILGGTELPLILCQTDFSDIEIFDTTQIHVESIVSKMIED